MTRDSAERDGEVPLNEYRVGLSLRLGGAKLVGGAGDSEPFAGPSLDQIGLDYVDSDCLSIVRD